MQTRSAYKGGGLQNEAAPLIAEYVTLKRLAKLGFTTSTEDLPAWKAEAYCIIDAEIDDLQAKEVKKKHGRR